MFGRPRSTPASRHTRSSKSPAVRRRALRNEWLEPRDLLSGIGLPAPTGVAAAVATTAPAKKAPTLAQPITVNRNAPVTSRSCPLSVLGADDGGEAKLTYSWSVTVVPSGGSASFGLNGTNGAKNTTVTFAKAGTYSLAVKIVDGGGLSVTSIKTVVVVSTLTSVRVSTALGQVLSPNASLTVTGVSQALVAQGLDQFGNALAASPTFTWSTSLVPSGAALPVWTSSGGNATARFSKAGSYTLAVLAKAGNVSAAGSASITVSQVLSAIQNAPTAPVTVTGRTLQPAIPKFVDQFGNAMAVTPALTWSTSSLPSGAPAPTFATNGGVTTVTFGMAGNYMLTARGTSVSGVSFVTMVTVNQTLTCITVSPNACSVYQGYDQQFAALAWDQFGRLLASQPVFAWSSSAGSIVASGRFTAPSTPGSCTVRAQSGSVAATAAVTVLANSGSYQNVPLAQLISGLDADGSLSRDDMMQILGSAGYDGLVDAGELNDLKNMLNQATTLHIPDYVRILASDVVNGNPANARFQGHSLGNLAAGSSATQLNTLIGKWFLGTDLPALCNTSFVYRTVAGSLFPHTPSHTDEYQGGLGDCYFITAMGTLADANPTAVANMFIDNGDGTFTVRFYTGNYGTIYNYSDGSIGAGFKDNNITADYVTVNCMFPTSAGGSLAYADAGAYYADPTNSLWIPLAEKAYAQWNETGKAGRDGLNAYASIQAGWMATVDAQVLGYNATDYIMTTTAEKVATDALAAGKAVTVGTLQWSGTYLGLYATHAYAIVAYNARSDTFTLYNPWGSNQPGPLSWGQLQGACSQLAVADASRSIPIAGVGSKAVSTKVGSLSGENLSAAMVDALFAADSYFLHHRA